MINYKENCWGDRRSLGGSGEEGEIRLSGEGGVGEEEGKWGKIVGMLVDNVFVYLDVSK